MQYLIRILLIIIGVLLVTFARLNPFFGPNLKALLLPLGGNYSWRFTLLSWTAAFTNTRVRLGCWHTNVLHSFCVLRGISRNEQVTGWCRTVKSVLFLWISSPPEASRQSWATSVASSSSTRWSSASGCWPSVLSSVSSWDATMWFRPCPTSCRSPSRRRSLASSSPPSGSVGNGSRFVFSAFSDTFYTERSETFIPHVLPWFPCARYHAPCIRSRHTSGWWMPPINPMCARVLSINQSLFRECFFIRIICSNTSVKRNPFRRINFINAWKC